VFYYNTEHHDTIEHFVERGLTSQPINDSEEMFDGSYLNIIWFSNDLKTNSIDKMIGNLELFDWNTQAENYQF
jgi:hypothetical protein